ncbi:MAG: glycosyltransferase [Pseudomonadota bacterium]
MIFGTVGTQLAFDRLVEALDAEAAERDEPFLVQSGPSAYEPKYVEMVATLSPAAFAQHFSQSRLIIAHAGIGTVLSAIRYRKPLIIVPRRHVLGEHRNDHQIATARRLENLPGLYVAWEVDALGGFLQRCDLLPLSNDDDYPPRRKLVRYLSDWISADKEKRSAP